MSNIPQVILLEIFKYLSNDEIDKILDIYPILWGKLVFLNNRHSCQLLIIKFKNILIESMELSNRYTIFSNNRRILLNWIIKLVHEIVPDNNTYERSYEYTRTLFLSVELLDNILSGGYYQLNYINKWQLIAGVLTDIAIKDVYYTYSDIGIDSDEYKSIQSRILYYCKDNYSKEHYSKMKQELIVIKKKNRKFRLIYDFFNIHQKIIEADEKSTTYEKLKKIENLDIIKQMVYIILFFYMLEDDCIDNNRTDFVVVYSVLSYVLSKYNRIDLLDDIFDETLYNDNNFMHDCKSIANIIDDIKFCEEHQIEPMNKKIFDIVNIPILRKLKLHKQTSNDAQDLGPVYYDIDEGLD